MSGSAGNYKLTVTQQPRASTKDAEAKDQGSKPAAPGDAGAGGDLLPRRVPAPKGEIIKEK